MKILKKILCIIFIVGLCLIGFILIANYTIEKNAADKTFFETEKIKKNKVGLVLGTSKNARGGRINLYFKYRIDAVVDLYNNNKIDYILVSGDNGSRYYNEPNDFKKELIKRGIPEDKIYADFAGFRTLDSVIRAKKIFGQEELTIISQKFHNERAIYLAEENGIDAIGFNARDVNRQYGFKVELREYLARAKVFLDILFNVQPKYLGDKIIIGKHVDSL